MTTNEHIFTLNKRIQAVLNIVQQFPESADKQVLKALLDDASDHLLNLQGDMRVMSDRITELTKMIYEPVIHGQFDYPEEGNYNKVREYVEARRGKDKVFDVFCKTHTRVELCDHLSNEFGWYVDAKNYGRNILRH